MGSHTFTEADIIAFARQFDPQSFHIDPGAAKQSAFGGLIASGWHTCAIAMRLMVDRYMSRSASLGSPGMDNIRWLAPVRAGDTSATGAPRSRPGLRRANPASAWFIRAGKRSTSAAKRS